MRDKVIRLFWLMTDQGVFALSNFVLNVQFARWLSPHEYGLFAISFTGFVDVDRRGSYLLALVRLHLLLLGSAIALCSLALIGAWGLGVDGNQLAYRRRGNRRLGKPGTAHRAPAVPDFPQHANISVDRQRFALSEILKFQARYAPFTLNGALGTWVTAESIMTFLARIQGLDAVAETRAVSILAARLCR